MSHNLTPQDVPLEAYREAEQRKKEFWHFLEKELQKIETFYEDKELECSHRLGVLRKQLHSLRDQRLDKIQRDEAEKREQTASQANQILNAASQSSSDQQLDGNGGQMPKKRVAFLHHLEAANPMRFHRSTTKPNYNVTPPSQGMSPDKDYTRKSQAPEVKYPQAKRRLKRALRELYRELELMKSYVLFNQTAFRKINKKYDKASRPKRNMLFVSTRVNTSHFVESNVLDALIQDIEDLYSRYFENGNRKLAVGHLKKKVKPEGAYNATVFRNGILLAAAVLFGVQGVVRGVNKLLHDPNFVIKEQTSYLLQVSGTFCRPTSSLFECDRAFRLNT